MFKFVSFLLSYLFSPIFAALSVPGFEDLSDYADDRVTQVGVDVITSAIERHVQIAEETAEVALERFAYETTAFKVHYDMPVITVGQPTDQNTVPQPVKGSERKSLYVPLFSGSTAWGGNYVEREYMTVRKAAEHTAMVSAAYYKFQIDYLLASIFMNATYTHNDEIEGELTISPLALTSDSWTYLKADGAVSVPTAAHHRAQAAAIDNSNNPLDDDAQLLDEYDANVGAKVVWIPPGLVTSIKALNDFEPAKDPRMQYGTNTDLYNDELFSGGDVGELIGYLSGDNIEVRKWRKLPANYYIMGLKDGNAPLAKRVHIPENLRGIYEINFSLDGNHQQNSFYWSCGFAPIERAALLVRRIGNASYAVPAGYTLPGLT